MNSWLFHLFGCLKLTPRQVSLSKKCLCAFLGLSKNCTADKITNFAIVNRFNRSSKQEIFQYLSDLNHTSAVECSNAYNLDFHHLDCTAAEHVAFFGENFFR